MNAWVYGKYTLGDKIVLTHFKNTLENCQYLGENVDLSKITPVEHNLIIISNPSLFQIDQDKVLAYIKKDLSRPLLVIKKIKTFGTVFFEANYKVERITTNKSYSFAGMLFLPKEYFSLLEEGHKTVAEIFRKVPYDAWNFYIIDNRRR